LNAVVAVETALSPRELLGVAKALEAEAGREPSAPERRWGPRPLDIDVLIVGDERVDEPDLVVPHPRIHQRAFGLPPLAGVVPTMGAFHEGHRSLMRAARAHHDVVVVSLFVNPLQFGPGEDLARYPRDLAGDLAVAAAEGVDVVFAPPVEEMYPDVPAPPLTTVSVAGLTGGLCGSARPAHFDGVATVVT